MKAPKNILIVSRSFYPVNSARSIRTTELAKQFAKEGHDVKVITPYNSKVHPGFEKRNNLTIKDLGQSMFNSLDVKGGRLENLTRRAINRLLNLLFEYPNIELMWMVKRALKEETDHDLMISIAVPHPTHWGVAWARSKQEPIANVWAADCGDPYMGLESDSFKKLFYFSIFEKWFSRKADFITVPFKGAVSAYYPEFHSKIRIIPQGFDFPEPGNENPVRNEVPTFAYVGNIVSYQHYAIPFFKTLKESGRPFHFIAYTKNRDFFVQHMPDSVLSQTELRDYVPREQLFKELQSVDFFLHFPYLQGTQRSLKLIDYAHIGKPILSYKDDAQSIEALQQFLKGDYSHQLQTGDTEMYKIKNVCNQFLELLDE